MDIDQWVESLNQAHPPSEFPVLIARPNATQKHRRGSRRSSLLEPFIERKHRVNERRPVASIGLSDPETSYATSTSASSSSSSSSSTPSSLSSDRKYQRRPRHRTKADKYISKPRSKPRSQQQEKKKKEKRKQKRKSKHTERHKHRSAAVTGVVQNSHAKNVLNHRLTLGASSKVGLYTKGRSSGPTRGKGLPDLVFSELKFLQKPELTTKEEPDPVSKNYKKKNEKQHKKRPRELSEDEISRYFGTEPHNDKTDDEPALSRVDASKIPTASPHALNLPEKPFLGFGSRNTYPLTTSYYSWSESDIASSPRVRHFGPDYEPLTVGQLQGERVEKLKGNPPMGEAAIEPLLAEHVTIELHNSGHESVPQLVEKTGQATRPTADSHFHHTTSVEATPTCVSNKHSETAATVTSHERKAISRTKLPEDEQPRHFTSQQAEIADNLAIKHHTDPWEELLKACEVAARPSIPNCHDEVSSRPALPAFQNYTDLDLWREDDYHSFQHGYTEETPRIDEHIYRDHSNAVEYGRDGLSYGLGEDNIPESLDTNNDYGSALEDEESWDEDGMKIQDATLNYRPQDFGAVDELATFWQPHKSYY
ncbi:hypothetical protein E4T47_03438 [Aureobasidium subglaciale]|nr:hypothetical protein E4T47_03438 [Aureobasidium subglaciale]